MLLMLAAVLTADAATSADADKVYLCKVGPPSLRFESSGPRECFVPTRYALSDSLPPKAEVPLPEKPTNAVPTEVPVVASVTNLPPLIVSAEKADFNSPKAMLPVPNLDADLTPTASLSGKKDTSIVTPEMLVDYFRPLPGGGGMSGGNGNGLAPTVVLPMKMGFTPPSPVPDRFSRATYKVE